MPPGVLSVITGGGAETGHELVSHKEVDKVWHACQQQYTKREMASDARCSVQAFTDMLFAMVNLMHSRASIAACPHSWHSAAIQPVSERSV